MTPTELESPTLVFDLAFVLLVAVMVLGVGMLAPFVWLVLLIASLAKRIRPRLSLPRAVVRIRSRDAVHGGGISNWVVR